MGALCLLLRKWNFGVVLDFYDVWLACAMKKKGKKNALEFFLKRSFSFKPVAAKEYDQTVTHETRVSVYGTPLRSSGTSVDSAAVHARFNLFLFPKYTSHRTAITLERSLNTPKANLFIYTP